MIPGTIVQRYVEAEAYPGGRKYYGPQGVVFANKTIPVDDGTEMPTEVTVRWMDGRVDIFDGEEGEPEFDEVTPRCFANLYLVDRAYGGGEEGGWWYSTQTPFDPAEHDYETDPPSYGQMGNDELAEEAAEALQAWCDHENENRRDIGSVLSEGRYAVELEEWPAAIYPDYKPRYC